MIPEQEQAASRTTAEALAGLIRESGCTVALTGAGVSVPSGIPDFRTPGKGLWEKVDPMSVATIDAFHRDTKRFWDFYRPRFHMLTDKEPNAAHEALAERDRGSGAAVRRRRPLAVRRLLARGPSGRRPPRAHPGRWREAGDRDPELDPVRLGGRRAPRRRRGRGAELRAGGARVAARHLTRPGSGGAAGRARRCRASRRVRRRARSTARLQAPPGPLRRCSPGAPRGRRGPSPGPPRRLPREARRAALPGRRGAEAPPPGDAPVRGRPGLSTAASRRR